MAVKASIVRYERARSDGLCIAHRADGSVDWWCRQCDGKRAPRHLVREAANLRAMHVGWAAHREAFHKDAV